MTRIAALWSAVRRAVRAVTGALVGRIEWEPPQWGRWVGGRTTLAARHLRAHPSHLAGVVVALLVAAGAGYWYLTRPKPHYATYAVEAPGLTEYDDAGVPSY